MTHGSSTHPSATAGGDLEAIPAGEPAPVLSPDGSPCGPGLGDEVLHLLHDSGTAQFTATLHQWLDVGALLSHVPAGARQTGFGGLGRLIDAISDCVTPPT